MKYRHRIAVLIVCLSTVTSATAGEVEANSLREFVLESQAQQAYGLYLDAQKVGWMIEELRLGTYEGEEVGVAREEGEISVRIGDVQHSLRMQGVTMYGLEGNGEIVFSEERRDEDGVEHRYAATATENGLLVKSQIGERKATRRAPRSRDTLAQARAMVRWFQTPPRRGETFESFSLLLDADDIDQKQTVKFGQSKTVQWAGVAKKVFEVTIDENGIELEMEMTADLRPIRGRMGPFEIRAEELATAKRLDTVALDMFTNLPVSERLGDPSRVKRLEIELSGLSEFEVPQNHRQTIRSEVDGTVRLDVRKDHRPGEAQPLTDDERGEYLKATPALQVDHKKIRKLARKIVGEDADPVDAAGSLQAWVFEQLEKRYDANASTALQVLDQEAGDCTEHALLFVALARAAGIPAREVGGLAYADWDDPVFAWHGWAQIHDGHAWVSVDPTWNQVHVDATHILFQDSDEDWSWVNVLGTLELSIVSFEAEE